MSKPTATVARLEALAALLSKYRNAYYRATEAGSIPSARMCGWIDEYDAARFTPDWYAYCEKTKTDRTHRALDIFA